MLVQYIYEILIRLMYSTCMWHGDYLFKEINLNILFKDTNSIS